MLSGPAALVTFTLRRILLTSAVDPEGGGSSGDGISCKVDFFLKKTQVSVTLTILYTH